MIDMKRNIYVKSILCYAIILHVQTFIEILSSFITNNHSLQRLGNNELNDILFSICGM